MIGIRIKHYREKLGLTQEELGKRAGFTRSPRQRIADIEAGRRNPTPATLRSICEAMGTNPGELTGTIPDRLKDILNRGEQPTLKSENEFYYLAGLFVATLVSLYPVSKKYRIDYFEPVNICHGQRLKDRIRKDLFTIPTSSTFRVESETRNKLITAFFGWKSEVDDLKKFNELNVMDDYMLAYFQTKSYPVI
jgi:transcriptional regulator with XRE-family HTH domain